MVFVKFHYMNRKKKISNVAFKLKQTQKVSLYNTSKQYYNHSSKMFSFLFFFFQSMYCLFKKMFVLSFFLFFMCCVQQCSSFFFFFFFPSFFYCPVRFCFCFGFSFLFFFFFFHNKLLIQCLFFPTLYLPLCLYLNTITIGSLPSLFNFSL